MFGLFRNSRCFALCFALMSTQAVAQGDADGRVLLGAIDAGDVSTGYILGDFLLSVQEGAWGAELGMFGVVGRLHETYASATWQRDGRKVEIGFPQPAYDRVAVSGLTQIMPRLALESISTTRSRATAGVFTESEFLPYGAVYTQGKTVFSLHGVPDTDIVVAGIGATSALQSWQLSFGAEALREDGDLGWNAKVQAIRAMDGWDVGAGLYAGDANDSPYVAEVFGRFHARDHIVATALLRKTQDADVLAGVGVTYHHDTGIIGDLALVSEGSNDMAIAVSVGFQF